MRKKDIEKQVQELRQFVSALCTAIMKGRKIDQCLLDAARAWHYNEVNQEQCDILQKGDS